MAQVSENDMPSTHIRITFLTRVQHEFFFFEMSSEFTFGDHSKDFTIFRFCFFFFANLADRDLTEYQITQTLTLS